MDYEKAEDKRIKYVGFAENTGYGKSAKALCESILPRSEAFYFTGILPGSPEKGGQVVINNSYTLHNRVIIHTVPEYFPYWYSKEKSNKPHAQIWGYTTWETDFIPDHWKDILNTMDGIFVPCIWNKAVFIKCGVTVPIEILPHISQYHGVKSNITLTAPLKQLFEKTKDHFLFYSIGVWSERKAPELLIRAFSEEFQPHEKVSLILKTGPTDWSSYGRKWNKLFRIGFGYSKTAFNRIRKNYPDTNIFHISDELSDEEIGMLHSKADCFVSLTRGEGWGMGAYEAAWFGKPIVTTDYGGVLDYLSHEHAFLVNYNLVPVNTSFGKQSYSDNQSWAEADISHARKLMRAIFENPEIAKEKGNRAQKYVKEQFSDNNIIDRLMQALYGKHS